LGGDEEADRLDSFFIFANSFAFLYDAQAFAFLYDEF
jgi:hypothetical protein